MTRPARSVTPPRAGGAATTEALLTEASRVLAETVGLRLDAAMRGRLARSLSEAAASQGERVADFVQSLHRDPLALQALLDRITVQETAFFRDPGQFDALARHVLHQFADPITIWSAGCANGQEAYSLAMVLAEAGRRDWRVLATDVSNAALERTRAGLYLDRELRGLSSIRRQRFMARRGSHWQVSPELRDRVSVFRHNIVSDPPPFEPGACPIVFCRNVIIYFGRDEVAAFIDRLHRWLASAGYLFFGFSESLWQITDSFQPVRLGDAFVYRQAGHPTASRVPSPGSVCRPGKPREIPLPEVEALLAAGQRAAASGDRADAIAAFRRSAYLDPDHPIAHLQLGLALEPDDPAAALRAFAAARAALERAEPHRLEHALEGFDQQELVRLLDAKLERGR